MFAELGSDIRLEDLIREQALVTLMIRNAPLRNLRIESINDQTIIVTDATGSSKPYPVSLVRQIRVQDRAVSVRKSIDRRLTPEEKQTVERAKDRAFLIFESARDQNQRMRSAMINAAEGNESAANYLRDLSNGNDTAIAIHAAAYLYLAGGQVEDELLGRGFASGNRHARAMAAKLAGLLKRDEFVVQVRSLLQDPTASVYIEAAKAAGRMGDRRALPDLYNGLTRLNRDEGLAAAYGISKIGGEEVRDELWSRLGQDRGELWYRTLYTLYLMNDEEAIRVLRDEAMDQPAYGIDVALLLTELDEWEGTEYLRAYMKKAHDPNRENLANRARVAAQLFKDGMLQAKVILQELVRLTPNQVYAKDYQTGRSVDDEYKQEAVQNTKRVVAELVGDIGDPGMMTLLTPVISSEDADLALTGCEAAVAVAQRDFAVRLREYRL